MYRGDIIDDSFVIIGCMNASLVNREVYLTFELLTTVDAETFIDMV